MNALGRASATGRTPTLHPARGRVSGVVSLSLLALAAVAAEVAPPGPAPGPGTTPTAAPDQSIGVEASLTAIRADIAAGRFATAQARLDQALLTAPDHPGLRTTASDLALLMGGRELRAATPSPVLVEWALAEIRQGQVRADTMARAGRFNDAHELLEVVRRNLLARELDAAPAVAAALSEIETALVRYRRDATEAAATAGTVARDRALAEAREQVADALSDAANTRAERIARIHALQRKALIEQALAECRVLIDRESEDPEISALYSDLLQAAHKQRKLSTDQAADDLRQELNERISRSMMPTGFDGEPMYADAWAARHPANNQLDGDVAEPAWRTALRDALRQRTSLDVVEQNGLEVIRTLAANNRLNVVIEPALTAGPERPVTLRASNLTLEHALTWICQVMDTRWTLVDGAVWIGTPPAEVATLAIYDVGILVHHGLDQPGKKLAFGENSGASGGLALFAGDSTDQTKAPTPEEIADLIKASITPPTWSVAEHAIIIRGNLLYVTAPAETHRILREFIRSQEQAQNLLVRVDARWLILEDAFAEEIGVDWTIDGTQLAFPGVASGFATQNPNSTFIGSSRTPLPATTAQSRSSVTNHGLKLSYGLLGPIQLSAVLTATENNLRSRVLTAPSVTTLNGIRSNVFVGVQSAYIGDYEVASSYLDPKISVIATGASLDVKPYVSADRKYVTLDFQPAITSIRFFTDYLTAVNAYVANGDLAGGLGGGGGGGLGGGGGGGPVPEGFIPFDPNDPLFYVLDTRSYPIELPNLTVKEASTTLTIPDRGSVLIGGFGKAADESSESRVPFLGNIPYLGRLFGHRGKYSDHEKLYLMATITIISYDEQEAKL